MRDILPEGRVGAGVALMSSSLGIGGAIGLPLTGLVAEQASWRWLFAGAAVLGALLVVAVLRWVDESPVRAGGRFDLPGAVGLAVALVCLLLAISKGTEWGALVALALLGASAVVFGLWGRFELRTRSPMVDLRVTARPAVLWTNVASVLIGFAMFAGFLVTTQVLQAPVATGYGFGLSLVLAGIVLLPIGGAMGVFSPVSARLSARFGARTTLLLGTSVLIVGNAGMAAIPGTVVLVMLATTVSAIGAALAYSALPLLIMDAVPATETAAANSLNTLMRMLGTSSCSAVDRGRRHRVDPGGRRAHAPVGLGVHRRVPGRGGSGAAGHADHGGDAAAHHRPAPRRWRRSAPPADVRACAAPGRCSSRARTTGPRRR